MGWWFLLFIPKCGPPSLLRSEDDLSSSLWLPSCMSLLLSGVKFEFVLVFHLLLLLLGVIFPPAAGPDVGGVGGLKKMF